MEILSRLVSKQVYLFRSLAILLLLFRMTPYEIYLKFRYGNTQSCGWDSWSVLFWQNHSLLVFCFRCVFFHSAHYQISLSFHPHMAITLQLVSSYWVQIFAYNISELVTQNNFFIDVTKLSCIKSSCRHSSLSDLVSIKLVLT